MVLAYLHEGAPAPRRVSPRTLAPLPPNHVSVHPHQLREGTALLAGSSLLPAPTNRRVCRSGPAPYPQPLRDALRACLRIESGTAAVDFGGGQGGEACASPQRAVKAEPTPANAKRRAEGPLSILRQALNGGLILLLRHPPLAPFPGIPRCLLK